MGWTIRPLVIFAALNLIWELVQLPLYTIWMTGSASQITYAALHCTAGDVMIGIGATILSRILMNKFHGKSEWQFVICFILLSIAYTVFSEWLNVEILKSWAYASAMPRLPPLGTGLTPVLQWMIVPLLTWNMVGGIAKSRLAGRPFVAKERRQ